MKRRFIYFAAAAFFLLNGFSARAETATVAGTEAGQADGTKAITLLQKEKLTVEVKPSKQVYEVNEAISFTVTTNKEAYVYLFAPGNTANALVFPTGEGKNNRTIAGKPFTLPAFASDKAGVEKIVVVASTKPLSLKPGKSEGEDSSAEKQIRIASDETADRVLQEFDVVVKPKDAAQVPPQGAPEARKESVVFVNTDKLSYKTDERLAVRYLATASGNLGLYVVGPDNSVTPLGGRGVLSVEQDKLYTIDTRVEPPAGAYKVVAVFQKGKADEPSMEAFVRSLATSSPSTKGIRVIEPPEAFSVSSFVIE